MIRRLATLPFACALLVTSAVALARAPVAPPTASELLAIVETLTAPEMDGRRPAPRAASARRSASRHGSAPPGCVPPAIRGRFYNRSGLPRAGVWARA